MLTTAYLKQDSLNNTPLTAWLAPPVFTSIENYQQHFHAKALALLEQLCKLAREGDATAQYLLVSPNESTQASYPRNTPLMLMVKAGDLAAVQLLLEHYDAQDLLQCTHLGNTVLHIAAISGQDEIFQAIIERATTLGIAEDLLNQTNKKAKTPIDILQTVATDKTNLFAPYIDMCDPLLGGDEINKAIVGAKNLSLPTFKMRQQLLSTPYFQTLIASKDAIDREKSTTELDSKSAPNHSTQSHI